MEIQISKPSMKYKAGQWLFINVPAVSTHQWHPFTITSCPFDPYISLHARQVGDFTKAFADAVGVGPAQAKLYEGDEMGMFEVQLDEGQQWPLVRLDGPYGAPAEDVFNNEIAVIIGTGIGVTPWASILKNIWHSRSGDSPPTRLRRVEFFWICRDTNSFAWFQNLLVALESQSLEQSEGMGDDFLRIHTYLTKHVDADTAQNIVLNSVGTEKDPLTELRSRTNFGRPDFKKLFKGMQKGIAAGTYMPGFEEHHQVDVGVYFCGPSAAGRDIKKACSLADSREVKFKFWKEHF